ncbi:MAG: MATE family efflux transporter [Acidimicrobiia bacterium]|nr:MATE family efflux transporter [Acidimicrobiia bacterium]
MKALDREITRLALPALGSLAVEPLVSLVDTAFVGRLGSDELAGLGISGAVFLWSFIIFIFLAYATTTIVAGAVGAGDLEKARRTAASSFAFAIVVGLAAATLLQVIAVPLVAVFGAGGEAADAALTYVRIRALAAPAVLVILAGNGVFRGHQNTKTPLLIALAFNLVNFVLDPVLIFGFDMGIAGAAWASVVAQVFGAVAFGVVARRRHLVRFDRQAMSMRETRELLGAGAGVSIRTVGLLAVFSGATAVAARISDEAVAAHRVVDQLFLFLALSVDALAVAAQAMIGKRLGVGDIAGAKAVGRRLFAFGALAGVAIAVLLLALRTVIPVVFTDEREVLEQIGTIYWFLLALQPLNAVIFVGDGVLLGWSAFKFMAVATVAAAVAAGVVLALVLPLELGLVGVYAGLTTLMVGRAVALGVWWRRTVS